VPFAAAISEHPVTAMAVGEVAGQVLESLGQGPDLALVFVTPHHAGALEDATAAIRSILEPATLLGCAAVSVAGNGREVEDGPAVSLWAGRLGPVAPVLLDPDGAGWPDPLPFEPQALLLLADPYTFAAGAFFDRLAAERPGLPVIGGMSSAPGGGRLALDGRIVTAGAVGALLQTPVRTIVSQGCRPIGAPYVVTRSERNVVYELGGQPALQRLLHLASSGLPEEDVRLINQGLHMGLVIDEHKAEYGRGDFLVRNVLGADRENGAIAVGDEVEVGVTAQFHVRDAATADEDLRRMLAGEEADAALLFTCNGRGARLFGEPDHDAGVLDEALGGAPVAGFFAAGEIGPVGGRNFLHGFTASIALFSDAPT
jgi:small ligand-binding sensory domain FIST